MRASYHTTIIPCVVIGIYTTLFPVLVSPSSGRKKNEKTSVELCAYDSSRNIRCHLQAVVLSELVLLILGQMADETIEVRNHVLVCLESLTEAVSHEFS